MPMADYHEYGGKYKVTGAKLAMGKNSKQNYVLDAACSSPSLKQLHKGGIIGTLELEAKDIWHAHFRVSFVETAKNFVDSMGHAQSQTSRYMSSPELSARFAAYLFSVAIRNCSGLNVLDKSIDRLLNLCGDFDMEAAIKSKRKWLVPMTGSLYDDLRTNFVAESLYKAKSGASDFISECLSLIISQYDSYMTSGPTLRGRFVIPILPDVRDEENVEYFFGLLTAKPKKRAAKSARRIDAENCALEIMMNWAHQKGDIWGSGLLIDKSLITVGDTTTSCFSPSESPINTQMEPPSLENSGIDFRSCFSPEESEILEKTINLLQSNESMPTDILISQTLSEGLPESPTSQTANKCAYYQFMSLILDRERLELYLARKEIYKKEKLAFDSEMVSKAELKTLRAAQQALERLKEDYRIVKRKLDDANSTLTSKAHKIHAQAERIKKLEAQVSLLQAENEKNRQDTRVALEMLDETEQERERLAHIVDEYEGCRPKAVHGEPKPLDVSVFDNLRIVICGGHTTWANVMRELHENIKIYPAEGVDCPDEVIIGCDCLWIQTNAISHPTYYRIENTAAINNIPVYYFKFAGHQQCKKQLVAETKKLLGISDLQADMV